MKKIVIVLIMCILVVIVVTGYSYSRVDFVNINDLYKLQYGAKLIPVIEQLCTIKGIDYASYIPELERNSVSVMVITSRNYFDTFMITGYHRLH